MKQGPSEYPACTLHIILATAPQRQERLFDERVRQGFFEAYRQGADQYYQQDGLPYGCYPEDPSVPILYNPIQYHLFGNYDIAYISLIDNFKFAQKLFEPPLYVRPADEKLFYPHSFQSFTGIAHATEQELKRFFYEQRKKEDSRRPYFLAICNCKLNNGLLIGNGADYLVAVMDEVREAIGKINERRKSRTEFLLLQTFSWFEVSILLFTDEPENLPEVMRALRRINFEQLTRRESLLKDSLYRHLFPNSTVSDFDHVNLFSDTHTYIGLHSDLVKLPLEDLWVQDFRLQNIKFRTAIEWQVKPGHMHLLAPELKKAFVDSDTDLDIDALLMLPGKSDYTFEANSTNVNNNLTLMRLLREDTPLHDHVRKFRTQVIFERHHQYKSTAPIDRHIFALQDKLRELGIPIRDIQELDGLLKSLKVSRPIRSKVLKLFSNFNNGIQDVILFPLFIDFKVFMTELQEMIRNEPKRSLEKSQPGEKLSELRSTVSSFEEALINRIDIFEAGYYIRILNCYQFEDITDFDLDFNTAVQQLLSAYSTMAMAIGSLLYKEGNPYGPIVQLNLRETVANYNAINYYTHHLTSPEFVFATIIKEILNISPYDSADYRKILKQCAEVHGHIAEKDPYLADMIRNNLISAQYLLNDTIRFGITYNLDFDLYYYWFWTYNLQNASLFDKRGLMNEEHFKKELFRILFIARLFGFDVTTKVYCPLQELFTYWERHFHYLDSQVQSYIKYLEQSKMIPEFIGLWIKMMTKELQQVKALVTITVKLATDTLDKIEALYKATKHAPNLKEFITGGFIIDFANKDHIFKELSSVGDFKGLDRYSTLYFQWYMHDYLRQIYAANNKKITFLRRNWDDGKPLSYFIRCEPADSLFLVDPSGGLFFGNKEATQKYFRLSSKTLHDIWNYAQHIKRDFILKQFNF